MLNKKAHICDCGRKSYGFRKCQVCRSKKYADNAIKRKSEKGGESGIDEIDDYFNYHIGVIIKNKVCCAECGVRLPQIPDRKNVCHLLPKSIFPSVRAIKENCIYLCWQHHADFDSTYEKAQKMKIWDYVKQKVSEFRHLVKERHKILTHFE